MIEEKEMKMILKGVTRILNLCEKKDRYRSAF